MTVTFQTGVMPINVVERGGIITELTEQVTATSSDHATDWGTTPSKIKAILNHASVPQPADTLPNLSNLYVTSRNLSMIDPGTAIITVNYERFNTRLNAAPNAYVVVESRPQLVNVTTQKDSQGTRPLVVEHSIGGVDQKAQLAEMSILVPGGGFNVTLIKYFDALSTFISGGVNDVVREWRATVNSNDGWQTVSDKGRWLCSDVTPRLIRKPIEAADQTAGSYTSPMWWWALTFEFLWSEDGWNQDVFWRDPSTGRPPKDLTAGNGPGVNVGTYQAKSYIAKPFNVEP